MWQIQSTVVADANVGEVACCYRRFFKVIAKNGKPVDEPFFRDTVLVHLEESIDGGMVPLDWGRWMMHCHILEHAASGMMTLVHVREP